MYFGALNSKKVEEKVDDIEQKILFITNTTEIRNVKTYVERLMFVQAAHDHTLAARPILFEYFPVVMEEQERPS